MRRSQAVTIRGDRIESVGPDPGPSAGADPRPAPGASVIDLSDHVVLPGLIDCHAHLIGEVDSGHGYASLVQRSGAQEALSGVRNARETVNAGFTTVRDVGT